ncbi:MAG TPA: FHA domain-containing protein [Candidatus Saccharimonadales bacterium]|jgi:pSer/pThr/pTyr-binding forkhead associated (FHA) protein|nr:FHA domain-containing protein [Candidatus Saccharimonadales bacterium]HTJ60903.1 FHA domain-containing protein [Candidatus Saccharimonadales bacterium]
MEITFAVILWAVRIAFLVLLYLFLIRSFRALQRALADERTAVAARQVGLAALVVTRSHGGGPRVGERMPLRAVSSVGRDAGNDIVLNDEAASAKHAIVSFADGEWWLEDAGSTNGTVLNGSRIWDRERFHYGDEVAVGRIALRLERAQ